MREVAGFQKIGSFLATGPGNIGGRKNGAVVTDFDGGVFVFDGEDESGGVGAFFDGTAPVVVFVSGDGAEIVARLCLIARADEDRTGPASIGYSHAPISTRLAAQAANSPTVSPKCRRSQQVWRIVLMGQSIGRF